MLLGDIRGNLGGGFVSAQAEEAEARHQHDRAAAGPGLDLRRVLARVVLFEVGVDSGRGRSGPCAAAALARKSAYRRGVGRRHDERRVLGADGVIRRHHADLRITPELGAIDVSEDGVIRAEVEDHWLRRRKQAAQDGRAMSAADARREGNVTGASRHFCGSSAQTVFGERYMRDHPLVGFARRIAEREDAVLLEDQTLDRRIGFEHLGGFLGEQEARRLDARHIAHALAVAIRAISATPLGWSLTDMEQRPHGCGR